MTDREKIREALGELAGAITANALRSERPAIAPIIDRATDKGD